MLDNEKVKLMTKIALYEKRLGKNDIKRIQFYEKDFISYSNFKMQISITIALIIAFMMGYSNKILDNLTELTEFNFIKMGIEAAVIWLVFMVIYTIINTRNNKKIYANSKARVEHYEKMLKDLEKIQ